MNNYNENSIKTLEPMEHIRKHTGMYLGSKTAEGLLQCVKEILSNSIDEFLNGSGTTVKITLLKNNGIRIEDDGRGIPHGKHKSGCSNLQACFGLINTGAKFDNANGSGYNTSGGQHGIGSKAVNAVSQKFIATTSREGLKEIVEFSKGHFASYQKEKINSNLTGTSVEFYPDDEVLEVTEFDIPAIKKMVREFSYLCKGLRFIISESNGATEEYLSKNGLADYMDYLSRGQEFLVPPFYFDIHEDKFQLEVAVGYTKSYSSVTKLYTNNIPQEKGTHYTGFKTAWTSNLNTFARENKWLKDKEANLAGGDYDEGMILILNFKMIDPVFKGQNKEELSSSEGRTYAQKLTTAALKELLPSRIKDIKIIVDKALSARKARVAAQKARENVRAPKSKGLKAKVELSDKLAECNGKDRDKCELWLLEGDSAIGSAKQARDPVTQSVMALKGKVLNTEKVEVDKMLGNKELATIISILGTGYGDNFNVDKCRYGKIIFLTDADVDGSHIDLLLLTFFYRYMRGLIESGKIYLTVPPLFRARKGNDYVYLKDEAELAEYRLSHTNFDLARFKGVGEMSADQLWETTMNPEVRTLKRMTIEDAEEANRIITELMGKEVKYRKEFLSEFGDTVEIDV